jgi:hypothetical protein
MKYNDGKSGYVKHKHEYGLTDMLEMLQGSNYWTYKRNVMY